MPRCSATKLLLFGASGVGARAEPATTRAAMVTRASVEEVGVDETADWLELLRLG